MRRGRQHAHEKLCVGWVLYQYLQQVSKCVFIGFGLSAPVSCGLRGGQDPCGFVTFVGYFLVDLLVLEVEGLHELKENANELGILQVLNHTLGRHSDIQFIVIKPLWIIIIQ